MIKKTKYFILMIVSIIAISLSMVGVFALSSLTMKTSGNISYGRNFYPLSLEENGGLYLPGSTKPVTYSYASGIVLPTANNLYKTGYSFSSWHTDSQLNSEVVTQIASNQRGPKQYYAKYTEKNYVLTYDLVGGEGTVNPTSYNINSEQITLQTSGVDKQGYLFNGWRESITFTNDDWHDGYINNTSGAFEINSNYTSSVFANAVSLANGITYTFNTDVSAFEVAIFNTDGTFNRIISLNSISNTYAVTENCYAFIVFNGGATLSQKTTLSITSNSNITVLPSSSVGNRTYIAQYNTNELVFEDQNLTNGTFGEDYSASFVGASNGTGDYTYSITNTSPSWDLDIMGTTISGETIGAGTYSVEVKAHDNISGAEKSATMTIIVNASKLDAPSNLEWETDSEFVGANTSVYATGVVSWDAVANATSYTVVLFNGETQLTSKSVNTNSCDILAELPENYSAEEGSKLYFTVTANGTGNFSNSDSSNASLNVYQVSFMKNYILDPDKSDTTVWEDKFYVESGNSYVGYINEASHPTKELFSFVEWKNTNGSAFTNNIAITLSGSVKYWAVWEIAEARIGSTYYRYLSDAFSSADGTTATIETLVETINISSTIQFGSGSDITLTTYNIQTTISFNNLTKISNVFSMESLFNLTGTAKLYVGGSTSSNKLIFDGGIESDTIAISEFAKEYSSSSPEGNLLTVHSLFYGGDLTLSENCSITHFASNNLISVNKLTLSGATINSNYVRNSVVYLTSIGSSITSGTISSNKVVESVTYGSPEQVNTSDSYCAIIIVNDNSNLNISGATFTLNDSTRFICLYDYDITSYEEYVVRLENNITIPNISLMPKTETTSNTVAPILIASTNTTLSSITNTIGEFEENSPVVKFSTSAIMTALKNAIITSTTLNNGKSLFEDGLFLRACGRFNITYNVGDAENNDNNPTYYTFSDEEQIITIYEPLLYSVESWAVSWTDLNHSSTLPSATAFTLTIPASCRGAITLTASYIESESYLIKTWKTILSGDLNYPVTASQIASIDFVNEIPNNEYTNTNISVGSSTNAGTSAYAQNTIGVKDITIYRKANGTNWDIVFYSPARIFAPVDSTNLFYNLTYCTSIDCTNLYTNNVTDMSDMFSDCSSLQSLVLSSFNTANVSDMGWMFSDCSSLQSLVLSSFNTANVQNMAGMFYNCGSLVSLDLSSFNTANVRDMGWMFNGCSLLESLDLSSFNTVNVENMDCMFVDCSSLENLNISIFNTANVQNMNGMFRNCSSLVGSFGIGGTAINISSNFVTTDVGDFENMFNGCSGLNNIDISTFRIDSSDGVTDMFTGCSGINELHTPVSVGRTIGLPHTMYDLTTGDAKTEIGTSDNNKIFIVGATLRTSWKTILSGDLNYPVTASQIKTIDFVNEIPNNEYTNTNISVGSSTNAGTSAYAQNTIGIKDITIYRKANGTRWDIVFYSPARIFAPVDSTDLFRYLTNCTSIDCTNLYTNNVTDMEYMFYNCSSLESLDLSSFNTTNVTSMGWMFIGCGSLVSLDLSSFNTANVRDMGWMFNGCSGLNYIDVSNFTVVSTDVVTNMFTGCSGINELHTPVSVGRTIGLPHTMYDLTTGDAKTEIGTSDDNKIFIVGATLRTSWKTILSGDLNYPVTDSQIATIDFVNEIPNNEYTNTNISVGSSTNAGTSAYAQNTIGVKDITIYRKANGTNWDIVFYSPARIFAPVDSTVLFSNLSNCTSIDCTNLYTNNVTDMVYMFSDCSSLESLDLSSFNTVNVVAMVNMFGNCSSLESLDLSSFNTENVQYMAGMFSWCEALESLDLSNFNTTKVTDMGYMFLLCSSLMSLDLSSFNTANVTGMWAMFLLCSSLMSLDLSSFNTANVTDMSQMFYGCSLLMSLDLSSFNTANVQNMSGMFRGCTSLEGSFGIGGTAINISSNFVTTDVDTFGEMFYGCSGLGCIDLSTFSIQGTAEGGIFGGCTGLYELHTPSFIGTTMYLPHQMYDLTTGDAKTEIGTSDNNKIFVTASTLNSNWKNLISSIDLEDITEISFERTAPLGYTSTEISVGSGDIDGTMGYATSCGLSDITVYENGTKMCFVSPGPIYAPVDSSNLFAGLTSCASIDCTKLYTNNVINMSGMFRSCSSLVGSFGIGGTAINMSSTFVTTNVEDIRDMFAGCSGLTEYLISSYFYSVTNMSGVFSGCNSLESLSLYNFNTANVTNMCGMFAGCSSLESLNISIFNTANVGDMGWMFAGCSSLQNLDLFSFNTANVQNMTNMFRDCTSLEGSFGIEGTAINIGSNFVTTDVSDFSFMFYSCSGINNIDVSTFSIDSSDDVTDMFTDCSGLSELHTPTFVGRVIELPHTMYESVTGDEKTEIGTSDNNKIFILDAVLKRDWKYSVPSYNNITSLSFKHNVPDGYVATGISVGSSDTSGQPNYNAGSGLCDIFVYTNGTEVCIVSPARIHAPVDSQNLFSNLINCISIDLENFYTTNVNNMMHMFESCGSLTSLDLSNFNTANVDDMNNMFRECFELENLDLSSFNTSNVEEMTDMFMNCSSLVGSFGIEGSAINISSNFVTTNVDTFGEMFYGCSGLGCIDLSTFSIQGTISGGIFGGCTGLYELHTPSFIGTTMYLPCQMYDWLTYEYKFEITGIDNNKIFVLDSVLKANWKNIISSSIDLSDITEIAFEKTVPVGYVSTGLSVGSGNNEGTEIYAIGCGKSDIFVYINETKLCIVNPARILAPVNSSSLFSGFTNCTNIGLLNFYTNNVTNMSYMFSGCSSLEGSFGIGGTAINISSNFVVTYYVNSFESMFDGCSGLNYMDVSTFIVNSSDDVTDMFTGCSGINELHTPASVGRVIVLPRTMYESATGNTKSRIETSDNNKIFKTAIYTITADANGGTFNPSTRWNGNTYKMLYGENTISIMPNAPISDDYAFLNWHVGSVSGEVVTTSTVFSQDTTIVASWQLAYKAYYVGYNNNQVNPLNYEFSNGTGTMKTNLYNDEDIVYEYNMSTVNSGGALSLNVSNITAGKKYVCSLDIKASASSSFTIGLEQNSSSRNVSTSYQTFTWTFNATVSFSSGVFVINNGWTQNMTVYIKNISVEEAEFQNISHSNLVYETMPTDDNNSETNLFLGNYSATDWATEIVGGAYPFTENSFIYMKTGIQVAKIGTTYYKSLQKAITDCQPSASVFTTVDLLAENNYLPTTVSVAGGRKVYLNLQTDSSKYFYRLNEQSGFDMFSINASTLEFIGSGSNICFDGVNANTNKTNNRIFNVYGGTFTVSSINKVTFKDNYSNLKGSSIYATNSSTVSLTCTVVEFNNSGAETTSEDGAPISVANSNVTISNATINNCKAQTGFIVYLNSSSGTVTFNSLVAYDNSGPYGVYSANGNFEINNSLIHNNNFTGGHLFYTTSVVELVINNTNIYSNTASQNDNLFNVASSSALTMTGGRIYSNNVGRILYISSYANASLNTLQIDTNALATGCIDLNSGTISIVDSNINNNNANSGMGYTFDINCTSSVRTTSFNLSSTRVYSNTDDSTFYIHVSSTGAFSNDSITLDFGNTTMKTDFESFKFKISDTTQSIINSGTKALIVIQGTDLPTNYRNIQLNGFVKQVPMRFFEYSSSYTSPSGTGVVDELRQSTTISKEIGFAYNDGCIWLGCDVQITSDTGAVYATLESAITAVTSDTIYICAPNIFTTAKITIPTGKTITIKNGYTAINYSISRAESFVSNYMFEVSSPLIFQGEDGKVLYLDGNNVSANRGFAEVKTAVNFTIDNYVIVQNFTSTNYYIIFHNVSSSTASLITINGTIRNNTVTSSPLIRLDSAVTDITLGSTGIIENNNVDNIIYNNSSNGHLSSNIEIYGEIKNNTCSRLFYELNICIRNRGKIYSNASGIGRHLIFKIKNGGEVYDNITNSTTYPYSLHTLYDVDIQGKFYNNYSNSTSKVGINYEGAYEVHIGNTYVNTIIRLDNTGTAGGCVNSDTNLTYGGTSITILYEGTTVGKRLLTVITNNSWHFSFIITGSNLSSNPSLTTQTLYGSDWYYYKTKV